MPLKFVAVCNSGAHDLAGSRAGQKPMNRCSCVRACCDARSPIHPSSSSCSVSTGAAAGGRLHRLPDGLAERLQPRAAAGPQAGGPRLQQEIHHAQSL